MVQRLPTAFQGATVENASRRRKRSQEQTTADDAVAMAVAATIQHATHVCTLSGLGPVRIYIDLAIGCRDYMRRKSSDSAVNSVAPTQTTSLVLVQHVVCENQFARRHDIGDRTQTHLLSLRASYLGSNCDVQRSRQS